MAQTMRRSQIYLVRTWTEARSEDSVELRGMVRDLHSGETRYFRTWDDLVAFVDRQFDTLERSVFVPHWGDPIENKEDYAQEGEENEV